MLKKTELVAFLHKYQTYLLNCSTEGAGVLGGVEYQGRIGKRVKVLRKVLHHRPHEIKRLQRSRWGEVLRFKS